MENKQTFFDFAAEVGLTKHFGGHEGTLELADLCHIGRGSYVLDVGATVKPLAAKEWLGLMKTAGFQDITHQIHPVEVGQEAKLLMRHYGSGGMLRILSRTLRLYFRNPAYRQFVRGVNQGRIVPENITEYFGYGLYVGKKASS